MICLLHSSGWTKPLLIYSSWSKRYCCDCQHKKSCRQNKSDIYIALQCWQLSDRMSAYLLSGLCRTIDISLVSSFLYYYSYQFLTVFITWIFSIVFFIVTCSEKALGIPWQFLDCNVHTLKPTRGTTLMRGVVVLVRCSIMQGDFNPGKTWPSDLDKRLQKIITLKFYIHC